MNTYGCKCRGYLSQIKVLHVQKSFIGMQKYKLVNGLKILFGHNIKAHHKFPGDSRAKVSNFDGI